LAPQPNERLLEVGSGTGALARAMALDVGFKGFLVGVDLSHPLNDYARRISSEPQFSQWTQFITSQAEILPFADNRFDGVYAARLLLHADDPECAVREMVRVLRPHGRVVLMDWDFETITVDHPDRELTRRLLHWRCDKHGGDNWSGRKLTRYAHLAGLKRVEVSPITVCAWNGDAALTLSLWRSAEVALNAGAISQEEHDRWIADLKGRIATGDFFASITYFIVKGWK
jgi:ubiquinone/menaquinone biosynthesis C-methylase UbiE